MEPSRHPQSSLPLPVPTIQVVVVAVVAGHDDREEVVGVSEGGALEVGLGGRVWGDGGHHGVRGDLHFQLVAKLARRALLPERRLAHPLARPRRRELVMLEMLLVVVVLGGGGGEGGGGGQRGGSLPGGGSRVFLAVVAVAVPAVSVALLVPVPVPKPVPVVMAEAVRRSMGTQTGPVALAAALARSRAEEHSEATDQYDSMQEERRGRGEGGEGQAISQGEATACTRRWKQHKIVESGVS